MTNFGGWLMPLQYTSIRRPHRAVREAVGLFDLSHMGEIRLKDDAVAQRLLTRDLTALRTGRVQSLERQQLGQPLPALLLVLGQAHLLPDWKSLLLHDTV